MKVKLLILFYVLKLISCKSIPDVDVEFKPSFGRIIGGEPDTETDALYQCSMRVSGWHFCGCAILSAEYVISTAHCINLYADNPGQKICVGSRNREPGMEGRLIDIANRIINPGYIPQNFSNDIGIIQLSSQIDFVRDKAKSIEISKNQLDDNDLVVFTGWGWTSTENTPMRPGYLQKIDLKVFNTEECNKAIGDIDENFVCTVRASDNRGAICYGDSGSPLVEAKDGTDKLVGIATAAVPCGTEKPDAFINVKMYEGWINKIVKS